MQQYKWNLSVLNGRYGDLEQRLLRSFATAPAGATVQLPGGLGILLMNLLQDGLVVEVRSGGGGVFIMGMPSHQFYQLTPRGREFIDKWLRAEDLD
jgi:hypothetical protein